MVNIISKQELPVIITKVKIGKRNMDYQLNLKLSYFMAVIYL